MNLTKEELDLISAKMKTQLSPYGLEGYPFKVEWYNRMVSPKFRLPFEDNCIGFVVISTPDMFEKAFIPYIRHHSLDTNSINDPIDDCMKYRLNGIKSMFSDYSVEVIHDFDLIMPYRRPKVLVQTAAHVSGAAFYYKPDLIESSDTFDGTDRLLGACIHPVFGGWFAIRGVIIFTHLTTDSLKQSPPKDVILDNELKKKLLIKFNRDWKDWEYRDVIPVAKKYSELQMKYFSLKPSERKELIEKLKSIQM